MVFLKSKNQSLDAKMCYNVLDVNQRPTRLTIAEKKPLIYSPQNIPNLLDRIDCRVLQNVMFMKGRANYVPNEKTSGRMLNN